MSRWLRLMAVAAPLAGLTGAFAADQPTDPTGRWLTADQAAVIEIARCGSALCGRIVGVTKDHPGDPVPVDAHGRPQCGQTIITGMEPEGANLWRGHIADPRNDRVYHAEMWLGDQRQLRLRGYIGVPLLGATQDWSRFHASIGAACEMATPS